MLPFCQQPNKIFENVIERLSNGLVLFSEIQSFIELDGYENDSILGIIIKNDNMLELSNYLSKNPETDKQMVFNTIVSHGSLCCFNWFISVYGIQKDNDSMKLLCGCKTESFLYSFEEAGMVNYEELLTNAIKYHRNDLVRYCLKHTKPTEDHLIISMRSYNIIAIKKIVPRLFKENGYGYIYISGEFKPIHIPIIEYVLKTFPKIIIKFSVDSLTLIPYLKVEHFEKLLEYEKQISFSTYSNALGCVSKVFSENIKFNEILEMNEVYEPIGIDEKFKLIYDHFKDLVKVEPLKSFEGLIVNMTNNQIAFNVLQMVLFVRRPYHDNDNIIYDIIKRYSYFKPIDNLFKERIRMVIDLLNRNHYKMTKKDNISLFSIEL